MKTKENPMNSEAAGWAAKIRAAEKAYADYYELVDETRRRYKNRRGGAGGGMTSGAAFNVFWSGIETQKPFLYFKQPRPCIDRLNKTGKPAEAMACRILERALEWNLGKFDFDSAAKYARNDFLISGCGILWEQYRPELVSVASDEGGEAEIKTGETVVSEYVDPKNFLADTQAGIWEEVSWIAKKMNIGLKEAVTAFGEKALLRELADKPAGGQICVYEIWDKSERRVMWLSCRGEPHFLKTADDPLGLSGFFPCPKPVFASQTNDSLIPEPDYVMIKPDLEELSGVIERMNLTIKALKVTGAYDSSFANLGDILNKDVALVSMADFDRLKSAGGLRGVIDFMPIEQYITALESLARRRDDIIQNIYRVTGISDIMRGSSTPSDTATAVRQKTSFGTLRNQDRQNDMQRFICDLYRLKAEIICEQFSTETLLRFLTPEEAAERLILHEGMRLKPYRCPAGKLTIGAGRNLEDNPLRPEEAEYLGRVSLQDGISREEALFLLHNDIRRTEALCRDKIPFWNMLDDERQYALLDMAFNLGIGGLLKFGKMLAALERQNYPAAAAACRQSAYARQTGKRAQRIARLIETGEWVQ